MATPPVIFFHIPKTGGQTLEAILQRQYPRGSIFELWLQKPETFTAFDALTPEQKSLLCALSGHMPFGYHVHLAPGARYITLLRDPVKRVVSEYWHLRQDPVDWGVWQAPREALASLDAYIDYLIANNLTNAQTRLLAGYVTIEDRPPLTPLPADAFERARENLAKHFAVVGLTEKFDESLLVMKQVLGWPRSVYYVRRNVRAQLAQKAAVPSETLARIEAITREDARLVDVGARMLAEQIRGQGGQLETELRKLRRADAAISAVRTVTRSRPVMALRAVPGFRQAWNGLLGLVHRGLA